MMLLEEVSLNTVWLAYLENGETALPAAPAVCFKTRTRAEAGALEVDIYTHFTLKGDGYAKDYLTWNGQFFVMVARSANSLPRTVLVAAPTRRSCEAALDKQWKERNPPKYWKREHVHYMEVEPDEVPDLSHSNAELLKFISGRLE